MCLHVCLHVCEACCSSCRCISVHAVQYMCTHLFICAFGALIYIGRKPNHYDVDLSQDRLSLSQAVWWLSDLTKRCRYPRTAIWFPQRFLPLCLCLGFFPGIQLEDSVSWLVGSSLVFMWQSKGPKLSRSLDKEKYIAYSMWRGLDVKNMNMSNNWSHILQHEKCLGSFS